jgi:hypothetical protein
VASARAATGTTHIRDRSAHRLGNPAVPVSNHLGKSRGLAPGSPPGSEKSSDFLLLVYTFLVCLVTMTSVTRGNHVLRP